MHRWRMGFQTGWPPDVDKFVGEAPLDMAVELSFSARLANVDPSRLKGPGRLVLNSPVISMKWEKPSTGAPVLGPDTAQSIIDSWSPFNQRDASITNMRDLYPTSHRIPMVALSEEYSVPFPNYLDNNFYQHVVKDGMHMRNHDFNEKIELVCSDLSSFFFSFFLNMSSCAVNIHIFFNASSLPPLLQAITAIRNMAR